MRAKRVVTVHLQPYFGFHWKGACKFVCCKGAVLVRMGPLGILLRKTEKPAKTKRGQEEGDGTENVINCRKLSQIVVTFYDEFYDEFYVNGTKRRELS